MNARWLQVGTSIVDTFGGGMAVAGAVGLVGGGIQFPLTWLRGTPFSDYTGPGLVLGVVVGGSALAAGVTTLLARREAGGLSSGIAGCIMLGWIVGEYALVGAVSWMQPVTLAYSLVMLGLAATLRMTMPRRPTVRQMLTRHAA